MRTNAARDAMPREKLDQPGDHARKREAPSRTLTREVKDDHEAPSPGCRGNRDALAGIVRNLDRRGRQEWKAATSITCRTSPATRRTSSSPMSRLMMTGAVAEGLADRFQIGEAVG